MISQERTINTAVRQIESIDCHVLCKIDMDGRICFEILCSVLSGIEILNTGLKTLIPGLISSLTNNALIEFLFKAILL